MNKDKNTPATRKDLAELEANFVEAVRPAELGPLDTYLPIDRLIDALRKAP